MNLLSGKHSHTALCAAKDLEQDWYQTFEKSLLKMINSPGGRLRPMPFTNRVTEVIKSHRPGEQEGLTKPKYYQFMQSTQDYEHSRTH